MTSKHTPGPWFVGSWGGVCRKKGHAGNHPGLGGDDPCVYDPVKHTDSIGIAAENGGTVVSASYDGIEISEADAHLIAAAPELRDFVDNDQWQVIDRAIDRYSAGEISDLLALGIITYGFLRLDADRQAAIAKAEGRS